MVFSDKQVEFFDSEVYEKGRKELYGQLLKECAWLQDGDKDKIMEFLGIEAGSGNSGNKATGLLKFCCKYHRIRAVHVTPTVFVNGIEASDISSGWTVEQWGEKLSGV